jgi:hypothetical protein
MQRGASGVRDDIQVGKTGKSFSLGALAPNFLRKHGGRRSDAGNVRRIPHPYYSLLVISR